MKNLFLCLLFVSFAGVTLAQSEIKSGVYLNADAASVSLVPDGTVEIFAQGLKSTTKKVALIVTPYDDGRALVRAYNRAKPFPPITLNGSDGTFTLADPGVYDIEILAVDESGSWIAPEYFEAVTVEGFEPQPDPEPDPVDDNLEELAASLVAKVNDPKRSAEYAAALKQVDLSSSDLSELKKLIGDVRRSIFVGEVSAPWHEFFQPMDAELGKLQTAEAYRDAWIVLIGVLERFGNSNQVAQPNWEPPSPPFFVGQIHDGRTLTESCDENGMCKYFWVNR